LRSMTNPTVDLDSVKRRLRADYSKTRNDPSLRTLDGFILLLSHCQKDELIVRDLIQDAANYIRRQFRFRWTMIGLKNRTDGLYRYEVMSGMREDAWAKQRLKVYKKEDFALSGHYSAGEISKLTRIYLEEENPLVGQDTDLVNRPVLLRSKRAAEDEALEADFTDTLIAGKNDELIGWIEYSGAITGKLPDAVSIRQIEVIAAIIGATISSHSRH